MSTRVLVIDDSVVFRRIVSDALAGIAGVEVVGIASNGRLAMARMAALQPDLVTLDIEMPEMNGIEVLEAMAAAGMKCGVIMLSSLTVRGGEMTVRALELGAFDFLTKPEGGSAGREPRGLARPSVARSSGRSSGDVKSEQCCAATHRGPRSKCPHRHRHPPLHFNGRREHCAGLVRRWC